MKITLDLSQLIQADSNYYPAKGAYQRLLNKVVPPFIKTLLEHTQGNKSAAARIAGIDRATLNNKIKYYDIAIEQHINLATKGDV